MRKLRGRGKSIELELTEDELVMINNALNEAREFVPATEFHARMGVDVEAVKHLLSEIHEVLGSVRREAGG